MTSKTEAGATAPGFLDRRAIENKWAKDTSNSCYAGSLYNNIIVAKKYHPALITLGSNPIGL